MHHEEIELNFDTSCQQILGLESEILWEARSTPTLKLSINNDLLHEQFCLGSWLFVGTEINVV
jgi:hypothetical protein